MLLFTAFTLIFLSISVIVSYHFDPSISEIWVFQNLTLKVKGQGRGWGQESSLYGGSKSNWCITLWPSCQSDHPFLRYGNLKIWPCQVHGWGKHLKSHRRYNPSNGSGYGLFSCWQQPWQWQWVWSISMLATTPTMAVGMVYIQAGNNPYNGSGYGLFPSWQQPLQC